MGPDHTMVWRGYIEHVNHDSRMYFSDLNGITRFIKKQIEMQVSEPGSEWRAWLTRVFHAIIRVGKKSHF